MLTGTPESTVTLSVLDGKFPYLPAKLCQCQVHLQSPPNKPNKNKEGIEIINNTSGTDAKIPGTDLVSLQATFPREKRG